MKKNFATVVSGRGRMSDGMSSLHEYDYYHVMYDLYLEHSGQSLLRNLMIGFDMGPLIQGQYTVAMDLFHPSWQKLFKMNVESDDLTGLVHFVKSVDDVTRFLLHLDPALFLDFVGHCKQV